MQKPNDFDDYEIEEAARRKATFDQKAMRNKSKAEQIKHDAGIGVETDAPEDDEDDEDDED